MTFKRRILFFGLVICVSVGAGALLVVLGLLNLRDHFDRLMSRQVAAKVQTVVIGREVNFVSRLTRNIMLGSAIEKDLAALDETIGKIEGYFVDLKAAASTPEELALVMKAEESTLAFVKACAERMRSLQAVPADRRAAAFEEYEKFVTPLAMASREAFGAIIAKADQGFEEGAEAFGRDLRTNLGFVAAGSLAVVAAAMVLFIVLLRAIQRPIAVLTGSLRDIRQSWDLSRRLDASAKDEMGDIARETNTFLQALHDIIFTVNESSMRVASGATELSATASELARASHEIAEFSEAQRHTSERTAAAMTQLDEAAFRSGGGARR